MYRKENLKKMKFETLRSGKFEKLKRIIPAITVVLVVVLGSLTIYFSHASYTFSQSIKLAEGTVSINKSDLSLIAVTLVNKSGSESSSNTVPTTGYTLDSTRSECKKSNGSKDLVVLKILTLVLNTKMVKLIL